LDEEVSHLSWIAKRLAKYRQEEGVDVPTLLLRYRKADEAIYADVMRFETRLWTYLGLEREGVVSDAER
jgi:hypothetical protein